MIRQSLLRGLVFPSSVKENEEITVGELSIKVLTPSPISFKGFIHEGNSYLPYGIRAGLMRPKTALSVMTAMIKIISSASQSIRLLPRTVDAFAKG